MTRESAGVVASVILVTSGKTLLFVMWIGFIMGSATTVTSAGK